MDEHRQGPPRRAGLIRPGRLAMLLGTLPAWCGPASAAPQDSEAASALQAIEDRAAIQQLVTTDYAQAMDERDWNSFALLFARGGSFVLVPPVGAPLVLTGHAAIAKAFASPQPARPGLLVPISFKHIITNADVKLSGDRATTKVYWVEMERERDGTISIPTTGYYQDIVVREDGRWKIQRREVH